MAKKIPFVRRLELALTQTDDELGRDKIFGIGYLIAQSSLRMQKDHFYSILHGNFEKKEKVPTIEEINLGKGLYTFLENSVNIPTPQEYGRKYGRKLDGVLKFEFELIKEYLTLGDKN